MRLHFCESCGRQFTAEGDLPSGAALCESCREKQGTAPAPKPGRTNTLLRASNARGSHRERSGSHPAPPTRGKAGLSPAVVWGGVLAMAVMIGLLLFAFHRVNVGDRKRSETVHPAHGSPTDTTTQPPPVPANKQDAKVDETAFSQLVATLDKLPENDRATRLEKLEGFVNKYPDSFYAPRVRTMIASLRKTAPRNTTPQ